MKKLLLTGFQPFGGEKVNPALEIVKRLHGQQVGDFRIVTEEVPVVRFQSLEVIAKAIDREHPQAVIAVGQAGGRPFITVERVGINVDDFRIPDNAGNQPIDEPIVQGTPPAYFATLPIKRMVQAMKAIGIPAAVSNTAGTFVCNHMLYGLLHELAQRSLHIPAGFVHIPYLPEQIASRVGLESAQPTMALETVEKGFRAMIDVL